ncbi:MAG: AAA family ATPase [Planctomycetes bacterium]|nr:AAA family ATPase [Planctomycetota bacterium]
MNPQPPLTSSLGGAGAPKNHPSDSGDRYSAPLVAKRDLHLLLEGIRGWIKKTAASFPAGKPGSSGGVSPDQGVFPGCVGVIWGEAGAGKSLLIQALQPLCRTLGIQILCGRSRAQLREPLGAVVELLRAHFAPTSPPSPGGKAVPGFPERGGQFTPRERWLLAELLPDRFSREGLPVLPDLTPEIDRSRLVDAAAEIFLSLARSSPLVMAVEDAQWLDELSGEVLATCLRAAKRRRREPAPPRLLILLTARPQEEDSGGPEIEELFLEKHVAFEVEARGYSREDLLEECKRRGLESLPLSQRELLLQKTAGSPLLVHWVLNQVAGPPGAARATRGEPGREAGKDFGLEGFQGFASQPGLVGRKYQCLGALEKAIVDLLAWIDRPVPAAELEFLLPAALELAAERGLTGTPPELEEACAHLEKQGWLLAERSGEGQGAWKISGSPVAAAVRGLKPPEERQHLHGRLGRRLFEEDKAGGFPAASPCEIYHHLKEEVSLPELLAAGEQAAAACERRFWFARAIEIRGELMGRQEKEDPEGWLALAHRQARLLEASGRLPEAVEIYRTVLSSGATRLGAEERARYCRWIGSLRQRTGAADQAVKAFVEGLQHLEGAEGSLEKLKIYAQLARLFLEKGDLSGSDRYLSKSFDLLSRASVPEDQDYLEIHRIAEEVRYRRGEYVEALRFEEQVFRRSAEKGDVLGQIKSAEHLSHLRLLGGDEEGARSHLELGLELARNAAGSRYLEARLRVLLGRMQRGRGRFAEALEHLLAGRDMLVELGFEGSTRELHASIFHLQFQLLQFEGGLENLEIHVGLEEADEGRAAACFVLPPHYSTREERAAELEDLRRRVKKGTTDPAVSRRLADLLLDSGATEEASRIYRQLMQSPEVLRNPLAMCLVLQKLGRWHRLCGDRSQALKCFEKSLECLGPAPEKNLLGNAYMEVGNILRIQGNLKKSFDYLLRSLRIFLELENLPGKQLALFSLAEYLREVGRRDLALAMTQSLAALADQVGWPRWRGEACRLRGVLALEFGHGHTGRRLLEQAGAMFEKLDLPRELGRLSLERGWDCIRRKDYQAALALGKECLEKARSLADQDLRDDSLHLLGVVESVLSNRGKNFLRAVEVLQNALAGAQAAQRVLVTRAILLTLARLYGERDKIDLARQLVAKEQALVRLVAPLVDWQFLEGYRQEAFQRVALYEGISLAKITPLCSDLVYNA